MEHTKIGVGVMIFKEGKILLGKRKGSHGAGEYSFPGGHLEYMEAFEACARRETLEETGIEIDNVYFQFLANVKDYAPKHYAHIGLIAKWKSGEAEAKEPEKVEGWGWYYLDEVPKPLFKLCEQAIEFYKTGQRYSDAV